MITNVPRQSRCKCCDGPSVLSGLVDFSKSGADAFAGRKVEPYAGIPVYFYTCEACRFTFTHAMDAWEPGDFGHMIYNDDYVRHDPDYLSRRPVDNANLIEARFLPMLAHPVLDYGSGLGLLGKELRARGHAGMDGFDPFQPDQGALPQRSYRTICAFEVFEHHARPLELMTELGALLDADGAILLSTLLIDDAVLAGGVSNWWYCMPRNGHISFYSRRTLARLAERFGLRAGTFSEGLHFFCRGEVPEWAKGMQHEML